MTALPGAVRALSMYAAVMVAGTTFFFFLHHVGNQLPYEVAKQRFATEFAAAQRDEGYVRGFKSSFEYCQASSTVMAGSQEGRSSPLADAVVLQTFRNVGDYCGPLRAVAGGAEMDSTKTKLNYWWGSKAIYAMALRYLSVHELRELTKAATWLAYALLAAAALLLSPRTFAVIAPLAFLGAFHSGVEYFADVVNGIPYLWAILSAVVLALLVRPRASGPVPLERMRLFCFVAGMVSSYLWLGDGHAFLAVTLMGLILYFGSERLDVGDRIGQVVWCIVLYLVGFVFCYGLAIPVRLAVSGDIGIFDGLRDGAVIALERTNSQIVSEGTVKILDRYTELFHTLGWGTSSPRAGEALTGLSLAAILVAVPVSVWNVWRSRFRQLSGVLWIVALMLVNLPNFLVAEDVPFKTSRYLFMLHGLCLSCLILAILEAAGRMALCLSLLAAGMAGVYLVSWIRPGYGDPRVLDLIAEGQPAIRSSFDVYYADNRLIYTRERCTEEDVIPRFFLHVVPEDPDDLERFYFNELNFSFVPIAFRDGLDDGRCVSIRSLPDYAIKRFRTGQYFRGEIEKPLWEGEVDLVGEAALVGEAEYLSVVSGRYGEPVARSTFDVYLDGTTLAWFKRPCTAEDVRAKFLLHLVPSDPADLPPYIRRLKFENRDFDFPDKGVFLDGGCVAVVTLPDYAIARIRTGQFTKVAGGGTVVRWSVVIPGAGQE